MNILIQPLDFSNFTFRASSVGKLCSKSKKKTPLEEYQKFLKSIEDFQKKCDDAKNKETKTYLGNLEKLNEYKAMLPYLEKHKDDRSLSDTAIKYLIDIYTEVRYGVKKNIYSKYFDSGIAREKDSIQLARKFDDELYRSYKEYCIEKGIQYRQFNEYVEGECDILYPVLDPLIVIDIKSCWDMFTFQQHTLELSEHDGEGEVENDIYKWQGIVYCKLYKAIKFKLEYCLVNMPDELIEDEINRIIYKYGKSKKDSQECQDAITEFVKKCNFDHIPIEARVIPFEFDYNEDDYKFLVGQIVAARQWLNSYAIKEWERETRQKWTIVTENDALNTIAEIEHFAEKDTANMVGIFETKVKKSWYYITETDSYYLWSDDEFNNQSDLISNLANFVCISVIGDITEAKKIIDRNKDILKNIESAELVFCPNCQSTLYHKYGEFDDFLCDSCGYDTADEEVEVGLKLDSTEELKVEVEIVPEIIDNTITTKVTISEKVDQIIVIIKDSDVDATLFAIENCKSREDCVELYVLKGAAFWNDNPNYKDKITERRNSFIITEQPKAEPIKTKKSDIVAPPQQPQQQPRPIFKIPTREPQPGDDIRISEFKEKYPKFTTVTEYKDLYIANREIIDRNLEFRNELNEAGKSFALKLAEQKRKEV